MAEPYLILLFKIEIGNQTKVKNKNETKMMAENFPVNRTLSLDYETLKILAQFTESTKINKSKLVREFIKFFRDNKEELDNLINTIKKAEEINVNV